jgi:hypothetical protein
MSRIFGTCDARIAGLSGKRIESATRGVLICFSQGHSMIIHELQQVTIHVVVIRHFGLDRVCPREI